MTTAVLDKSKALLRLKSAGAVTLGEKAGKPSVKVQVMRTGAFEHPWYGTMLITPTVLSDMVKNFKDNVRRQDLPADFFHESDREAAGWFTDLYVEENGSQLWGDVQPTPKLLQMLADKEVRYFSADFYFEWTDPETNVSYKNVLNGGGFVNRPFIKGMQPVAELSEINEGDLLQMKTIEQLNQEIKTLSEKHADEVKALSESVKSKDAEIATLKGEKAVMVKEKELAEKEAKFAALLSEGKACAAQKDAYMAGDFEAYAKLQQPLNPAPKGGNEGGGATVELSEDEKAICKTLGLTEAEYRKANPVK